jgi:hypothetical protein
LVAITESGPLDELQRAQVDLLRGQLAFALNRDSDASPLLLKAAKRLEPLDQRLARETYLEALTAVFFPGILASDESVLEAARAARAAPPASQPPRASDLLLDGLALLITEGYAAGTPTLRRAVNAFRGEDISRVEGRRWQSVASRVAAFLWDDETWDVLSARFVQLARDAGALSVLPLALATRSAVHSRGVQHGLVAARGGEGDQRGDGIQPGAVCRAGTRHLPGPRSRGHPADRGHHTGGRASGRGTGRADIHSLGDRHTR